MISISDKSGKHPWIHRVEIDDILLDTEEAAANYANGYWEVWVRDSEQIQKVVKHRFIDIPTYIISLVLDFDYHWSNNVRVTYSIKQESGQFRLIFTLYYDLVNWKEPWSSIDYTDEFEKILRPSNINNVEVTRRDRKIEDSPLLYISFSIEFADEQIEDEILRYVSELHNIHQEVVSILTSKVRQNIVIAHFNFPEEARAACEQYLLYFVQFLADLGVQATAELHHEVSHVLFAVSPVNKDVALENIKRALEIFLQLPSNPGISVPNEYSIDFKVQQLVSNIHHLNSQLALASAVLQAKDATIQAQQVTIVRQQRLLTDTVMFDSLTDVHGGGDVVDTESLLGGAFAITKFEGKGFEINLPLIYRWLRQLMSKQHKHE